MHKETVLPPGNGRACSQASQNLVESNLGWVKKIASHVVQTFPQHIDLDDLIQDGVFGLIDAANRFDEERGIKFETFAVRRVRGAMIDALRRSAWPRNTRRRRRELEAARDKLRGELCSEPTHSDLAHKLGVGEDQLTRTIHLIAVLEATAGFKECSRHLLPLACVPSEPEAPDSAYSRTQVASLVRTAVAKLPSRERKIIALYYFRDMTMAGIGKVIGVKESRVSQLHAKALSRLRTNLERRQSVTEEIAPPRKKQRSLLRVVRKPDVSLVVVENEPSLRSVA